MDERKDCALGDLRLILGLLLQHLARLLDEAGGLVAVERDLLPLQAHVGLAEGEGVDVGLLVEIREAVVDEAVRAGQGISCLSDETGRRD